MRVACSQPTFLSWIGFYAMIDQVDTFVFLDDVPLEKQSWQTRNRIRGVNGTIWLNVPIIHNFGQLIKDTAIDYSTDWVKKHIESIRQSYAKSRYSNGCLEVVGAHLRAQHPLLADLTIGITVDLSRELGIETRFLRSSALGVKGSKGVHLEGILRAVGATEYLANPGSRGYLLPCLPFKGIDVRWHDYKHPVYPQRGEFVPYLSIVDLMMNCGERSLEIIREGVPCESVEKTSELVLASS